MTNLKKVKDLSRKKKTFHASLFGTGTHQLYTMSSRKSGKDVAQKKQGANLRGFRYVDHKLQK